jgi:hypothetical protein
MTAQHDIAEILFKVLLNIISPLSSYRLFVVTSLNMMGGTGSVLYIIGFDINGFLISRGGIEHITESFSLARSDKLGAVFTCPEKSENR